MPDLEYGQTDDLYQEQKEYDAGYRDLLGGIILVVIGILIIALIVAAAIVLIPAIVVAIVVWLLTGSFLYAGIAFLIVALLSIVAVVDD